jgi:parallel beta-helix repeat protein
MMVFTLNVRPAISENPGTQFSDDFSTDSGMWKYSGSAYRDSTNQCLVLTEPVNDQGGVALFNNTFTDCFTANFSYRAGGGTGADGFAFFFYKQNYSAPGYGGGLAFNGPTIIPGYGIEFDNWQNVYGGEPSPPYEHADPSANHIALIKDHVGNHLLYVNDLGTEDNTWHNVTVRVRFSSVKVLVDGSFIFQWNGTLDRALNCFGFCGGTGSGTNWHIIDNFVVSIDPIADTITVPDDFLSIQEAINHANEGDTIFVRNGTYYEHVVVDKTVSLLGENRETTIIDGSRTGNVVVVTADKVTIEGLTVQNCGDWQESAILLENSNGCNISHNLVRNNDYFGIRLDKSSYNIISNNIVSNNYQQGIGLYSSSHNLIHNNKVIFCHYYGIIIHYFSNNNTISNNNSTNNNWGITIHMNYGDGNIVNNNTVLDNNENGIVLYTSQGNIVSSNLVSHNGYGVPYQGYGVRVQYSEGDKIYHNNIIDNSFQNKPFILDSLNTIWDNGFEGNYWSDYNGTDSNGDGIGDTPYIIDSNNTDHYPLMNPYWIPADVNHDLKVDILDVVRICAAYGTTPSDPEWNPHADIAQPYGKIDILDVVLCTGHYAEKYP